jgi:hypothetical protein
MTIAAILSTKGSEVATIASDAPMSAAVDGSAAAGSAARR